MAKAKVRGLDEAIDEVFKNYEKALTKAMKYAAEKARDDIEFKAKSCLWEYYWNFQPTTHEPNIYERTGQLENAFVPYMSVKRVGDSIVVSAGMGYDSTKLDGIYYGSKKWRPVDGSWVLNNYLKGIHPTTDGSSEPGAPYFAVVDEVSPETKMKTYLDDYIKTFNKNVFDSFFNQIMGR